MKLHPPNKSPERIMVYGDAGSGKSSVGVDIAHAMTGEMYVIDTDYSASWYRSLAQEQNEELAERVHVEVVGPDDWKGQLTAVRHAAGEAGPGDWLVLDSASPTWLAVRTLYVTMKHGEDFFDFFATGGSNDNEMGDVEMNWNAINSEYAKLYRTLFSTKAHLLLTAEADAIGSKEDRKIRGMFEVLGFKPKGQKTLSYTPHTVLYLTKTRMGEYHLTTVKDRERKEVERAPLKSFSRDYLMKIAGWRPKKGN